MSSRETLCISQSCVCVEEVKRQEHREGNTEKDRKPVKAAPLRANPSTDSHEAESLRSYLLSR